MRNNRAYQRNAEKEYRRCLFAIYMVTCVVTGRCYVGYTGGSVRKRWDNHVRAAIKRHSRLELHVHIRKYGPDNFVVICIEELFDENVARGAEIQLISDLELNINRFPDGIGLNMTDGGDGSGGHKRSEEAKRKSAEAHMRPVDQYTKDRKLNNRYESIAAALRDLGKDPTQATPILRVLEGKKKTAYGFMWMDAGALPPSAFKDERNKWRGKPVIQYVDGECVARHRSAVEAGIAVGGQSAHISSCCNGKRYSHKGYQWRYEDSPPPGKYKRVSEKRQIIEQMTLDGRLVAVHASQKEAAMAVGGSQSGISLCVSGRMNSYKGYLWRKRIST